MPRPTHQPGYTSCASTCLSFALYVVVIAGLIHLGGTVGRSLASCVALLAAFRLYPLAARLKRLRALRLADVDDMDGWEFEEYVASLLERQGYSVELTGASGDLGVDLIAEQRDTRYAVQVKRHSHPVSRRAVSDAVAGADHYDCNAAMVVTNQYFTPGALDLAESTGCELVDRDTLGEWVVTYGRRIRVDPTHRTED